MLSTNAVSIFILHHHQNGIFNKNLRSIQDIMRASKPAAEKYKKVCDDFPNLAIPTKSATPNEVQLTFTHVTVGNKSLGVSVVVFALAGNLDSTSIVSINMDIAFATDSNKIRPPIIEVLLRAAAGDLACLKNRRDWTPRNSVLFLLFLMVSAMINGKSDLGELLNIFAHFVTDRMEKGEDSGGENDDNDDDDESAGGVDAEDKKTMKMGKTKQANTETLANTTDNFNNVLEFIQAVSVESP